MDKTNHTEKSIEKQASTILFLSYSHPVPNNYDVYVVLSHFKPLMVNVIRQSGHHQSTAAQMAERVRISPMSIAFVGSNSASGCADVNQL